jgi:hypothetical protein
MRHRIRIQPYLSPEVHQKLRTYASNQGQTESAVAEKALAEYLARDQIEEALVVRRLDVFTQSVKGVQREQEVLAQAVVHVAKFLFRIAAGSAPDAKSQAERRYEKPARGAEGQRSRGQARLTEGSLSAETGACSAYPPSRGPDRAARTEARACGPAILHGADSRRERRVNRVRSVRRPAGRHAPAASGR